MSRKVIYVVSIFCFAFSSSFPIPEDAPAFSSNSREQQLAAAQQSLEQAAMLHEKTLVKAAKSNELPTEDAPQEEPPQEMVVPDASAKEQQTMITPAVQTVEVYKAPAEISDSASVKPPTTMEAAQQVSEPMMPMVQAASAEMAAIQDPPAAEKTVQEAPGVDAPTVPAAPAQVQPVSEEHLVVCEKNDQPKDTFILCSNDPSQH